MSKAEYAKRYEYLEAEIRRAIEDRFDEIKRPGESWRTKGKNVVYFKNSQPITELHGDEERMCHYDANALIEEDEQVYATDRLFIKRWSLYHLPIWCLAYIADEITEMSDYDAECQFDFYEHDDDEDDYDDEDGK